MAKGIKVCKVCGKEYEACHTLRPNLNSEFRWQDVACCPEHGAAYLAQVMEARGLTPKEAPTEKPKRTRRKKQAEENAE